MPVYDCYGNELEPDQFPFVEYVYRGEVRGDCANTRRMFSEWHFESDWRNDVWDGYEDGLDCDEWCETYSEWLATIAPKVEWPTIYKAFQSNDWRRMSCGGCI